MGGIKSSYNCCDHILYFDRALSLVSTTSPCAKNLEIFWYFLATNHDFIETYHNIITLVGTVCAEELGG